MDKYGNRPIKDLKANNELFIWLKKKKKKNITKSILRHCMTGGLTIHLIIPNQEG
jgi:hypothetical protein